MAILIVFGVDNSILLKTVDLLTAKDDWGYYKDVCTALPSSWIKLLVEWSNT
jgi:hypothetical protein